MQRKTTKKLMLAKETLLGLGDQKGDQEMKDVVGAGPSNARHCPTYYYCTDRTCVTCDTCIAC
jgi:hypothetical protein